jgi:hypothetical protein
MILRICFALLPVRALQRKINSILLTLLLPGILCLPAFAQDAAPPAVQPRTPKMLVSIMRPASGKPGSSQLRGRIKPQFKVRPELTPVNTGPGIVYTCDPSVALATCTYLNTTVAGYYNSTFTNANANIYVTYGTTGLAETNQYQSDVSYANYVAALNGITTKSAIQVSALSALSTYDATPYGSGNVDVTAALASALGLGPDAIGGLTGTTSVGAACTPGTGGCYDAVITVTNDPSTPLYYDNLGGAEPSDAYDFYAVVQHETDEVLGASSCITTQTNPLSDSCNYANEPSAVDLFRYSSAGNLILDSSLSTAAGAYFSYNGGTANGANGLAGEPKLYNTLADDNDYADFLSSSPDCGTNIAIQDAEGCPGEDASLTILNDGGGEIGILTAVGYSVPPPTAQITVATSPANLLVSIDSGTATAAPLVETWIVGSSHTIATSTPQAGAAGVQYVWDQWSDDGDLSHSITVPSTATAYTAIFTTIFQLTTVANPSNGGTVTPASGSYYPSSSVQTITATPAAGYYFTAWTGSVDITSTTSASTTVTMNAPESITAGFAPVPGFVVTALNDPATATPSNCPVANSPASSNCSLRDALAAAGSNGAGSITFASGLSGGVITLGSAGTLNIPSNTSINGATSAVTVSGANAYTVFTVAGGVTGASIGGLTITGGNNTSGGGIDNKGALAVTSSTIFSNVASATGSNAAGGGINNSGTLTVSNSAITGNSATASGGLAGGGGIAIQAGTVTLNNTTITGNSATAGGSGGGGGIVNNGGTLIVTNSTISANSADGAGGGAYFNSGTSTLANSILSGNTAGANSDFGGTAYTDNGGNVVASGGTSLTPLGNYGGPTQTMVPLPGDSSICAGTSANATAAGLTTDQRGFPLPDPNCPSGTVDSGAVQTKYALAFPNSFLTSYDVSQPMTPSILVALTESGIPATTATNSVLIADGESIVTGTTSVALSGGQANFANLVFPEAESSDTLKATLSLNPALTPPLNLSSLPSPTFQVATGTATLTYPNPGGTIGTSQTFNWNAGSGVTAYWLNLGYGSSAAASKGLYNSGPIYTTSVTVNGIGANGVKVYATLYSLINSVWLAQNYTFTESGTPVLATLTAPTPGSKLSGASASFTWTTGGGAQAYWLNVGTGTFGTASKNIYSSGQTNATTASVTGIPALAQPFYATLYSLINGVWQPESYSFTESGTPVAATLTLPASGTKLNGSATFTWSPGQLITNYWLTVGDGPGGAAKDLYSSGPITSTTASVSGLPTYGGTLYVTLYSLIFGVWQPTVYTFTETGTPQPSALTFPGSGATLSSTSQTFNWNSGNGVTYYWLTLGNGTSGAAAKNLYSSGQTTARTATVTGLPAYGVPIYATLYSYINGVWEPTVYTFNSSGSPVAATMISPTAPSTLPSGSETFTWTAGGGVTAYWLNLGTSPSGANSKNIYSSGQTPNTSANVTGLPSNGETIYATLNSLINGVWHSVQYTYTAY